MSTEGNKAVVRRFFEEVFNEGNLALIETLFAADFGTRGRAQVRRTVEMFRAAFPDIRFTVEDMVAEGDAVVVRVTFRGTHRGEFMGIAPTDRQVTVQGVELAHVMEGRIVGEVWHYYDELRLLHQLGVRLPIHHSGA